MYERYYGLRETPFDLTPNPRFLFLSAKHREALSHLQYGISRRKGIALLLGEAGTGKTTLVHTVLEELRSPDAWNVYLSNPLLTRAEFFEFLAWGFGLEPPAGASKSRFLIELTQALVARAEAGGTSALIIDEAQCLSDELLEEIRLLTNIETAADTLLPIVMVGQPELADRLNGQSLRPLKQRIALRCALPALDAAETAEYISNRISVAGGDGGELFTTAAVEAIFEQSRGVPRTISVICDNALVSGFAADERPVDRETVMDVCRDFDVQQASLAACPSGAAVSRMWPERLASINHRAVEGM